MTQSPPTPRSGLSAKPRQAPDESKNGDVGSSHASYQPNLYQPRGSTHGLHASSSSPTCDPVSSSTRPAPRYLDRDDPRHGQRVDDKSHLQGARRRSRSPIPRRDRNADATGQPAGQVGPSRSVPWKDLRAPLKDPRIRAEADDSANGASAASPASTSRPSTTAATKRFANDISRWNRKQSELHQSEDASVPSSLSQGQIKPADPKAINQNAPTAMARRHEADTASGSPSLNVGQMSEADLAGYDYKDPERIACLLCQRKFKSIDTLHRHESESQLHRDNLANADVCRQGVTRHLESKADHISQPDQASASIAPSADSLPFTYRDRASERRAVFGADTPAKQSDSSKRMKVFDGPSSTPSTSSLAETTPQSAPEKPIDTDNVGSKLLAMMGWSQGQGLGAHREGRTDIVETKMYKPGAGLGSSAPTASSAREEISSAQASHRSGSHVTFTGYLDRAKDRKHLPALRSCTARQDTDSNFGSPDGDPTIGARQRLAQHSQHQQQ